MRQFLVAVAFVTVGVSPLYAQSVNIRGNLPAGTNNIGRVDAIISDSSGNDIPLADETAFVWKSLDLDESEEEVDANTGCLAGMILSNLSAATVFVKVYNLAPASVTVGTTAPSFVIPLPTGGTTDVTGAFTAGVGCWAYNNLSMAATTDLLEDGTPGAPGTNDVIVTVFYKN